MVVVAVDWAFAGSAELCGCCASVGNVVMRMKAVVAVVRHLVLKRMDVISHRGWRSRSTIGGFCCSRRIERPVGVDIAGAGGVAASARLNFTVGRIVTGRIGCGAVFFLLK